MESWLPLPSDLRYLVLGFAPDAAIGVCSKDTQRELLRRPTAYPQQEGVADCSVSDEQLEQALRLIASHDISEMLTITPLQPYVMRKYGRDTVFLHLRGYGGKVGALKVYMEMLLEQATPGDATPRLDNPYHSFLAKGCEDCDYELLDYMLNELTPSVRNATWGINTGTMVANAYNFDGQALDMLCRLGLAVRINWRSLLSQDGVERFVARLQADGHRGAIREILRRSQFEWIISRDEHRLTSGIVSALKNWNVVILYPLLLRAIKKKHIVYVREAFSYAWPKERAKWLKLLNVHHSSKLLDFFHQLPERLNYSLRRLQGDEKTRIRDEYIADFKRWFPEYFPQLHVVQAVTEELLDSVRSQAASILLSGKDNNRILTLETLCLSFGFASGGTGLVIDPH